MKYWLVIILFSIASVAAAEPMTLTNAELVEVQTGLKALGGLHDVIIKEGERERVVSVPFKLKAGVVDVISRNIITLKATTDGLEMTRATLLRQANAAEVGKPRDEAMTRIADEFQKLMGESATVDLARISARDLGREEPTNNPIPGVVMTQIAPILQAEK